MTFIEVSAEIKPDKKTEFMLTIEQIISELDREKISYNIQTNHKGEKENLFAARLKLKQKDYNQFCNSEIYYALTGSLKILCNSYTVETINQAKKIKNQEVC